MPATARSAHAPRADRAGCPAAVTASPYASRRRITEVGAQRVGLHRKHHEAEAGDHHHRGELFFFGLNENDKAGPPTRNRDLYTPGFRFRKPLRPGSLDYELEAALQVGDSRLVRSSNDELDHLAWFLHAEAVYFFESAWSPRVALQFDYASGDRNPRDNGNDRYDTLFGARRFEFGPSGVFGPFFRANRITPGGRFTFAPSPRVGVMTAVRGFWLAERKDAWVGTGLQDPDGDSGR